MMKALLDSGVWWRRTFDLPISRALADFLEHQITEWWLSPLSVTEMLYKVTHKGLPGPSVSDWLERSLEGYRMAPLTLESGRIAGEWRWKHGDPVDRLLAAIARTEDLTLVHTDTRLKPLTGFPQKYFPAVSRHPS